MLNEPIDILEIATRTEYQARQHYEMCGYLNSSIESSIAYEEAKSRAYVAYADLQRVHAFIQEFARAEPEQTSA